MPAYLRSCRKDVVENENDIASQSARQRSRTVFAPVPPPHKGNHTLQTETKRSGARKRAAAEDVLPARQDSDALLNAVHASLADAKAEDVVAIDLDGKSSIADDMVIASGRSTRHVAAIAEQLVQALKGRGHRDLRVEGMGQCDWVLIDAGDVVVHIFRPEVRSFYNLEKLWSTAAPGELVALS